jgi:tetratricopeptide (TPR) repeat protein
MWALGWTTVLSQLGRLLYLAGLAYVLYKAAPLYWRWAKGRPTHGLLLALLVALPLGLIPRDFGLGGLFWHADGWIQFAVGLGLAELLALLFVRGFSRRRDREQLDALAAWSLYRHGPGRWRWPSVGSDRPEGETEGPPPADQDARRSAQARPFLNAMSVPLVALLLMRFLWAATASPPAAAHLRDWRLVAGLLAGLLAANAILWVMGRWPRIRPVLDPLIERLRIRTALAGLRERFPIPGAVAGGMAILLLLAIPLALIVQSRPAWEYYTAATSQIVRLAYIAALAYVVFKALPLYARWVNRQPIYGAILALLLGILFGLVGREFGLGDLFWHQDGETQFVAGLSLSLLFVGMFILSFYNEKKEELGGLVERALYRHGPWIWLGPGGRPDDQEAPEVRPPASSRPYLNAMAVPLALLLLARFVWAARGAESDVDRLDDWRLVAGLALGILAGNLALWVARKAQVRRVIDYVIRRFSVPRGLVRLTIVVLLVAPLALFGVVLRIDHVWERVPAASAVCVLFAAIAVLSFATYRNEIIKVCLGLLFIAWLGFSNSDPYKMRYPKLDKFYAKPVRPTPPTGSYDGDSSSDGPSSDGVDGDAPSQKLARRRREVEEKLARKRREIDELRAAAMTRPRDHEAQNDLGRAYFEAGELEDGRAELQASRLAGGKPEEPGDGGGEESYQQAVEAFSQAIRFAPNEALAYAGRGAARDKQLRRAARTGQAEAAGKILAKLLGGDGKAAERPLARQIAEIERSIRDDFIMARRLDPDDRGVGLACFEHFDSIADHQSLTETDLTRLPLAPDEQIALAERVVSAKVAMGDLDGAIADIDRGMIGLHAELRDLLVRKALASGPREAAALLARALEAEPGEYRPGSPPPPDREAPRVAADRHFDRAAARSNAGDLRGALGDFVEAAKLDKSYASTVRSYRGEILAKLGRPEEALDEFRALYNANIPSEVGFVFGDHLSPLLALAFLLARKGDVGGALDYLDRAEKIRPKSPDVLALRGIIRARAGDLDGARGDLAETIQLQAWGGDSMWTDARRILARILVKSDPKTVLPDLKLYEPSTRRPGDSCYLLRALDLIDAGRPRDAIKDLDMAIQGAGCDAVGTGRPGSPESRWRAYVARGDLRVLSRDPNELNEALDDYAMARLLSKRAPSPYARRGMLLAYDGDLRGGLRDLEEAVERETWAPGVLGHYGAVLALKAGPPNQGDDFLNALGFLNQAIARESEDPEIHAWRGLVLIFGGFSVDKAFLDFREVHRLDPTFPSPHASCGAALAWRGLMGEAIEHLRKAIEEDPRDGWSLRHLGAALAQKGRFDEALRTLATACDLDRRDARARALRGAVLAMAGKAGGALTDLDDAVRLDPGDACAHALRGAVLALGGDPKQALVELDCAIRRDPREPWAFVLRGAIRSAGGDARAASRDRKVAQSLRFLGEPLGDFDEESVALADAADPVEAGPPAGACDAEDAAGGSSPGAGVPPKATVVRILSKMTLCKERDWFNGSYFNRRDIARDELDGLGAFYKPIDSEVPTKSPIPERPLEPGGLDDVSVLEAWEKQCPAHGRGASESDLPRRDDTPARPKLVVVATSGGGITAAYWTALCLTELEHRHPHFARHVRVITGASGGMVGAAEFVASLNVPPANPDPYLDRQRRLRILARLRRDSLTPVVREMILSDIPSMFVFGVQPNDRGRVLEGVWERPEAGAGRANEAAAAEGLGMEFLALAKGEKEGWRPSLIVSPMILEGTQQLLISNLNLEGLGGGLEFFKQFRRAPLKLSTALRMNAAFPFVSPAVNLPTAPPRRVLDAGYKENYGVELATEWLEKHRQWLKDHTSGVILIQIRAYPMDVVLPVGGETDDADVVPPADDGGVLGAFGAKVGTALQWATSPFEGLLSVNKGTMITINNQKVDRLRAKFNDPKSGPNAATAGAKEGRVVFRTFVLTSTAAAPLSWYLTDRDTALLEKALESPANQKRLGQIERLLKE